jgi:DNA-nicking Smr family endonuclease
MKRKPEQPSSDTDDLFRQAMQGVTPIAASDRIPPAPPPLRKESAQRPAVSAITPPGDFFSDHGASEIPPVSYLRPGMSSMTLRKLRRGQWPVEDSLDLHGLTLAQARVRLFHFLQHAVEKHYRCVNVIHGKGWQTGGNEGVLKIHTRHWLSQFPQVLGFCEPPANAGGGGAVWVLLKSA